MFDGVLYLLSLPVGNRSTNMLFGYFTKLTALTVTIEIFPNIWEFLPSLFPHFCRCPSFFSPSLENGKYGYAGQPLAHKQRQ